jgi:hypothetical protein
MIASVTCGWQAIILYNTRWVVQGFVFRYFNIPLQRREGELICEYNQQTYSSQRLVCRQQERQEQCETHVDVFSFLSTRGKALVIASPSLS